MKSKPESTPNAERARYEIRFEDKVDAIVLGDYGSDINAVPVDTAAEVLKAEPGIKVKHLETPHSLSCAFISTGNEGKKLSFSASKSVKLNFVIALPGSNIPLRIRGFEFLIVDQPMVEVILGRPFLDKIGFNLTEHLYEVHDRINDMELDKIDTERLKMATIKYRGMSYTDVDDDPVGLPEGVSARIGEDAREDIDKALSDIVTEASRNGISDAGRKRLAEMLEEYRDVFRIKLGKDPPAKVEPLVITLVEGAHPYRSRQRTYGKLQRDFIIQTVKELEEAGAIYKNPSSKWASPALAVPKPGSAALRFTVDLRGPNARTVPIQSTMPHLESDFQDIEGSKCFANVDLAHGYWQIPLAEESQEMMSILTPLGVYSSYRLLQGGSDSGNHFQAVLAEKFQGRVKRMIQWLDDFLFYVTGEGQLLDDFEAYLGVCKEIGLKIHAEKTNVFTREVKFCGRIISAEGIKYNPRNLEVLLNMKRPEMASDLQQFICATNWMRNSIPDYAKRIEPLHNLLETCYKEVGGKRTKRALRNLNIADKWGAEHDSTFASIKSQLASTVKLAYPRPDAFMCLFTDASDTHWSAILTQVPESQRRKLIEDQDHEPLCFLSGAFTGSSANWSMPEKEGFAVVEGMRKVNYIVSGRTVSIFTDHANLVYMYDPYGRNPGIAAHTASKLMRWALKLSEFRYVVEHIAGERNVWADMLTRWAVQPKAKVSAELAMKALMLAPINPGLDPKLDWPCLDDIIESQESSAEDPPSNVKKTESGWKDDKGRLWIPSEDELLKLRILIAAHTGYGGHRAKKVTEASVSAHFVWKNMKEDVTNFVGSCLHCLATAPGSTVPRPLGHALHATEPNKLLHFDFCFMSKGQGGLQYVLVMKDDFSGFVRLKPAKETTAEVTATYLIEWFSDFGVVEEWVSDRGTHFKNQLISELREKLMTQHHFTLAYCPWSNGTVEVVCRELLRAARALLSVFQLPESAWPQVLPIVQSVLNNAILERLGNRCPRTAFLGLPQDTPLLSITKKRNKNIKVGSIDQVRAEQRVKASQLHTALDKMHKEVAECSDKKRRAAVESHNRKTNVRPINFTEGDYVLRGARESQRGKKPQLKWHGPFQVIKCKSEFIFVIKDILTGKTEEAHGRRLKLFRNSDYQVGEDLLHHLAYQQGELLVIEKFLGIRSRRGTTELEVKWKGFTRDETDWVSVDTLQEDVPVLLQEYLTELKSSGTIREQALAASI